MRERTLPPYSGERRAGARERMRWTALLVLQLLAPAHGRTLFPAGGRVRERAEADSGVGGPLRMGGKRVLAPALAVRAQLEKMPEEWKDRLRTCRHHLGRCLSLVKRRPRASLGAYLLWRLLYAHARIQTSKRLALRAFRRLGAADPPVYHITIVTTAALPWKTGTAVNALLRAAYLAELGHNVTLCVPWIHPEEQSGLFPGGRTYDDPRAQEVAMREWLQHRDGEHAPFRIAFYPARYDVVRGSILPLGDTIKWTGVGNKKDLCVLEEPEHLNWYHGGVNWRKAFKLTIGVVHTNYCQ